MYQTVQVMIDLKKWHPNQIWCHDQDFDVFSVLVSLGNAILSPTHGQQLLMFFI